ILNSYHTIVNNTEGGPFGGPVERRMIDRGQGQRSLLAQYMLPPEQTEVGHPRVANYNGYVRSKEDAKWRQVVAWINEALVVPAPDYGIRYEIPNAPPPLPPSSAPSTQ